MKKKHVIVVLTPLSVGCYMLRGVHRVTKIAALAAVVVVLIMFGLTLLQRRIVFPRHLVTPLPRAGADVPGLEKLWLDTDAGRVEAWYLPAHGASPTAPAPLVVFAHGNAELIDYWPETLEPYRRLGVSLLLPEYRGYGRSAGSPSEEAIVHDFEKFVTMLVRRPEVDAGRLIYHGRSLGGGVVCALAARRTPAALILQSTFTSLRAMAARFMLPGFLVADPFDNLSVVSRLDVPLLIVHGRQDDLIPFSHAEQLARAGRRVRFLPLDGDHNSCPPDWGEFFSHLAEWLRTEGLLTPAPAGGATGGSSASG